MPNQPNILDYIKKLEDRVAKLESSDALVSYDSAGDIHTRDGGLWFDKTTGTKYGIKVNKADGALEFYSDDKVRFIESDGNTKRIEWSLNNATPTQYFNGTLGGNTTGLQSFSVVDSSGMTLTDSDTHIRCDVAGIYYACASQLVQINSGVIYYSIQKNGTTLHYYYTSIVTHMNAQVSAIANMAVNDYFDVHLSATANVWTGIHSRISVFRIG